MYTTKKKENVLILLYTEISIDQQNEALNSTPSSFIFREWFQSSSSSYPSSEFLTDEIKLPFVLYQTIDRSVGRTVSYPLIK